MQAGVDFFGHGGINAPLAFDTAKASERRRDNADTEMGLAAFPRARMAGMARAFVLYRKDFRGERRFELLAQPVRDWS